LSTTKYSYLSTSGNNLRFRYVVEAGLSDSDGIGVTAAMIQWWNNSNKSIDMTLTQLPAAHYLADPLAPSISDTITFLTMGPSGGAVLILIFLSVKR
jgi:hypothetical protein